MEAYKFTIRYPVYFNDKFSHNVERWEIIHTEYGLSDARKKIQNLKKSGSTKVSDDLTIRVGDEYIAYEDYLGHPILKQYYEYEK